MHFVNKIAQNFSFCNKPKQSVTVLLCLTLKYLVHKHRIYKYPCLHRKLTKPLFKPKIGNFLCLNNNLLNQVVANALLNDQGSNAAALTIAEQYVGAFENLARTNNTLILPANANDISSMVTQARIFCFF